MSRPHSARERKVGGGTGKTNAVQPVRRAPPVLKQRPKSARSPATTYNNTNANNNSQDDSLFGSTSQFQRSDPPPREDVVAAAMKTHFYSTLYATKEGEPGKTFLPKSRFPTVPPVEYEPATRYKRPSIAPKWFLEHNSKPTVFDQADFRTDVDLSEKAQMVDEFIGRNKYRMSLYNHSFKNSKISDIRDEMMGADRFLNQMTTYAYRERSYVSGTSSARMKSLIDQSHQQSLGEARDPFLTSLNSSRREHNRKLDNILAARTPPSSDFVRGFKHTAEYGNFSNFNGILKANENSVLKR